MIKEEALRYIDAFVDDELSVKDALEVQEWIGRDGDCRAEFERVVALKQVLRGRLSAEAPPAPEMLKRRVRKAMRREGRRHNPILRPAFAAAAAVLLFALGWGAYQRVAVVPSPLVADTMMVYRVEMQNPLDFRSSDVEQVAQWLNKKFHQPEVRPIAIPNAELLGVRLCPYLGKKGAAVVYRSAGRNFALLIGESSGLPYTLPVVPAFEVAGKKIYEAEMDGFRLAFWKRGVWLYALVSEDTLGRRDVMKEIIEKGTIF